MGDKTKKLENLLLLSCRSPFLNDSKIYAPMANLYLKSYVNKHLPDVNVVLADDGYHIKSETIGTDGQQVKKYLTDERGYLILDDKTESLFKNFDAFGISIMTPQREEAHVILRSIKDRWPDKTVIAGGPHVKHYLNDMIKAKEPYDYFVPLDGEKALVGILEGKTDNFSHIYSRTGIKDGKHVTTELIEDPRILVDIMSKQDIYDAPRPDRSSQNATDIIRKYHYFLGGRESTTMMTARGCPELCSFCEEARMAVKHSSLENLILEMDDIANMGYGGVYIFDDLFALSIKGTEPICKELKKRDLIFRCNSQARYFTKWGEDFAKMLSENGCYEIAFGAETGSQKILDNIQKRTTVEMNYKTVEYAKKHGLIVKAFILLGLPGETRETLKDTEKFIANSGIDDFGAYIYYPYKGTQVRDALDRGEDPGLKMLVSEGTGAYATINGGSEAIVRTAELSNQDLLDFRKYLIEKYKPASNKFEWDKFRDTHLASNVEYKK